MGFAGYRNWSLIVMGIATSTWLIIVGIHSGVDLLGLATVIGAKDAGIAASIGFRGYNKKSEALANGKTE